MNYIRHLNGFFERVERDERLTAYHVSLYMALFRVWNQNRFRNPFPVCREELMARARIGSTNTYARCMKQLCQWQYIRYRATGNAHTGWKVSCIAFDTRTDTGSDTGTATVYKEVNKTNGNKQEALKIFNQEKNGQARFHSEQDKDYAEPL